MKHVLVTGARGFIGSNCLGPLKARGYEVHAVSRQATPPAVDGVSWHHVNLLDASAVADLLERVRPTHLLHLAWCVVPGSYASSDENYEWVSASVGLVRRFSASGGLRLVSIGSSYEYDWQYGYCSETLTPIEPDTVYGACKRALFLMLQAGAATLPKGFAWPRVFFTYGPNEHPDRLVAYVIRSLLAGQPAECSHGQQLRDYLYVRDVADALVALLDSDVQGPVNVASGTPVAVRDVVRLSAKLLGRESLVRLGAVASRPNDLPLVVGSVERLKTALPWRPRYSLEAGLVETIEWWRERSIAPKTGVL